MKKGRKTEASPIDESINSSINGSINSSINSSIKKSAKSSIKDSIEVGGRAINYEIFYSKRRKRAALVVRPDREVEFRVPMGLERARIREMVREKAVWVFKKLDWFEENGHPDPSKHYVQGEEFLFLGEVYSLKIMVGEGLTSQSPGKAQPSAPSAKTLSSGKVSVRLNGQALEVRLFEYLPDDSRGVVIREAVCRFYAERAAKKVGEFVEFYSKKLVVPSPPLFQVKYQRKRWGSCSAKNVIRINFQLQMAPPGQLEYVVVHEICHIKEKNHSPAFWALVEKLMPGYGPHREGLKKEGWRYVL